MSNVSVKLLKQHEHKGTLHPPGTVLTLSASNAEWLKKNNVAADELAENELKTDEPKGGKHGKRS